jgi:lipopolysaccharide export system protein LptA
MILKPTPFVRLIFSGLLITFVGLSHAASLKQEVAGKPSDGPKEEPSTLIVSDTLHYDDTKRESTFTGNVIMTRALMTLNSDVLKMREDADGFQFGTATVAPGKRVFIRQERPENFEVLEGIGDRAEYDGKDEIFDLIGQAIVTRFICGQRFDSISGQKVRYNQKTDVYEAFAGPESGNVGGRVRSIAQPRSKVDAAVAACKASKGVGTTPDAAKTTPTGTEPAKTSAPSANAGTNTTNTGATDSRQASPAR